MENDPLDFLFQKPPIPTTILALDAMYYHAALKCLQRARDSEPEVKKALNRFDKLRIESNLVLEKNDGDHFAAYSDLEPLYIQMDGASERAGLGYSPLLEAAASAHILCVAALESHINARASELLTGRMRGKFEFIDLEFKWLLFPKLLGKEGFDPGAQPFQSFSMLIKFRNKLVHYKQREEIRNDEGVPTFLDDLGLTIDAASKSVECVPQMITVLAKQLDQEVPYWLLREPGEICCFEFRFVDPPEV